MPQATINGARLWYDVRGSGEPVLLHHGYTASHKHWLPVAERLENRYRIVLMDCRGTGASEHTADGYTLEQYAADVVGLLDTLGLDRVSFAGHSMGGGVGYVLADRHPERLERLILMAPIPSDGIDTSDQARRAQRARLRVAGDREGLLDLYRAGRFRPEVETDAWFEGRVEQVLAVSDGHYDGGAATMAALRLGHRLPNLTTPTLMIAGAVDSLLEDNLTDFLRLPNATLQVFARAGHEIAVHEPDGVADVIDAFMTHGPITAASIAAASGTAAGHRPNPPTRGAT